MELLVTYEDVKNELGVDLGEELNLQPREVNLWIKRQERAVLNYIAAHKMRGIIAVKQMLKNEAAVEIIKQAIIEHINYLHENKYVEPDLLAQKDGDQLVPSIALQAQWTLENSGLLYSGTILL